MGTDPGDMGTNRKKGHNKDGMGCATYTPVDIAASGLGRAKNLLDRANQLTGHRALAHDARNLDDLVERDVAGVLDWRQQKKHVDAVHMKMAAKAEWKVIRLGAQGR